MKSPVATKRSPCKDNGFYIPDITINKSLSLAYKAIIYISHKGKIGAPTKSMSEKINFMDLKSVLINKSKVMITG